MYVSSRLMATAQLVAENGAEVITLHVGWIQGPRTHRDHSQAFVSRDSEERRYRKEVIVLSLSRPRLSRMLHEY
jgi:hypothetical protein